MGNRYHRRTVLRTGSVGLASAIGGCMGLDRLRPDSFANDESSTPTHSASDGLPVETPAPGTCEAIDLPDPEATDEGRAPRSYPDLPDLLRPDTATFFAREFEIAHSFNRVLDRLNTAGYEVVHATGGVPEWAIDYRANGYLVGVNVEVTFSDTVTPTPPSTTAPAGTIPSAAWYYVTDSVALRNEQSSDNVEPPMHEGAPMLEGARPVRCPHPAETAG